MANEFYALMARMRYITRWGLMRNTFSENIQEHSHQVAVLAHALALIRKEVLKLDGPDPDRCAVAALYHDASEILTGDLPTPIKYYNPPISRWSILRRSDFWICCLSSCGNAMLPWSTRRMPRCCPLSRQQISCRHILNVSKSKKRAIRSLTLRRN